MTTTSDDLARIFADATTHHRAGRLAEAAAQYDRILIAAPTHADTLHLRGVTDLQQGRCAEALPFFDAALVANPAFAAAQIDRAGALIGLGRYLDALEECDRVLGAEPTSARALTNRALALHKLERLPEALESAERAIAHDPRFQEAHISRANILFGLKRKPEAAAACDRALALGERNELLALRAACLSDSDDDEQAFAALDAVYKATPDVALLAGDALNAALRICRWDDFDQRSGAIFDGLAEGRPTSRPFVLLLTSASPQQQKTAAELYFRSAFGDGTSRGPSHMPGAKIRIAYLSSDFRDHPVSHVVIGLLEAHDRTRFDITCIALGGDATSGARRLIVDACDRMIDVDGKSDDEIVAIVRALGIDIAVDLNGYTKGARTGVFARGIAPLQVNYLGYPGTLGSACYEYIVGDPITTPLEHAAHFTERLALLPHTYFPANAYKAHAKRRFYTRRELSLPETGFVFCCFNGVVKITPDLFDVWMRLLASIEGSVLWLSDNNPEATRNLRAEAQKRGVAGERLVFAPRTVGGDYLWRQATADLFLDTFHYNAHSTAADALMMGLPILTRRGETFASRVAASMLTVAGFPELVTDDADHYESMAQLLATQPTMLTGIKRRLERNIAAGPLFDVVRYTRNLERAYARMMQRYHDGLPPDHISVSETD